VTGRTTGDRTRDASREIAQARITDDHEDNEKKKENEDEQMRVGLIWRVSVNAKAVAVVVPLVARARVQEGAGL
jgi:hypothetical protein